MIPLDNVYILCTTLEGAPTQIYHDAALRRFVLYHGATDTSADEETGSGWSNDESGRLTKLWTTAVSLQPNAVLAGWKLSTLVLPILVRRSMMLQVPVPEIYRTDPLTRYGTVRTIDTNRLYTQGVGFLPDTIYLEKVLKDWGIEVPEPAGPLELAKAQYEAIRRYLL